MTITTTRRKARDVLERNDRGGYTIPTAALYPFQWNWDSAITALGWLAVGAEARAWQEFERLFEGQWHNGMVPHIVFHEPADSYFPGPEVWGCPHRPYTSAISQPPLIASILLRLVDEGQDKALAEAHLAELLPRVIAHHRWWYRDRDPEGSGLVCSYHPWESGMDNSPQWDRPLAQVAPLDRPMVRRDTGLVAADQRPHQFQYDRYLALVEKYRECNFDAERLYQECPYRVLDVGIIAILHRATEDLVSLCRDRLPHAEYADLEVALERTRSAMQSLWHEELGAFVSRDSRHKETLPVASSASLLPLYAGLASPQQAERLATLSLRWLEQAPFGLASADPASEDFEPQRYWRGPSWLHINWLIALGFERYGMHRNAESMRLASQRCVDSAGYYEYFHSVTGQGCGGADFSWTAAMDIYWVSRDSQ